MEGCRRRQQPPQTVNMTVLLILIATVGTVSLTLVTPNPHLLYRWELRRWADGTVVATFKGPLGGEPPHFITTLCSLVPVSLCERAPQRVLRNAADFYMCPAQGPSYCNQPDHYYCGYWGCETVATAWQPAQVDADIVVGWWPPGCAALEGGRYPAREKGKPCAGKPHVTCVDLCGRIRINITNPMDPKWDYGKSWGMLYYEEGTDQGGRIVIQRYLDKDLPAPMGPNRVLAPASGQKSTPTQATLTVNPELPTLPILTMSPED